MASLKTCKMSSFSTSTLEKKLGDLSNTQHSIQTMSLWIIHHRKHAKNIVQIWYKELQKGQFPSCLDGSVLQLQFLTSVIV